MDVRTLLNDGPGSEEVEITGWLVIIDDELYLLEEPLCEDDKDSMKIKIAERSIIYALCGAVLPLGGGESFVFHKAKLIGTVSVDPTPETGCYPNHFLTCSKILSVPVWISMMY